MCSRVFVSLSRIWGEFMYCAAIVISYIQTLFFFLKLAWTPVTTAYPPYDSLQESTHQPTLLHLAVFSPVAYLQRQRTSKQCDLVSSTVTSAIVTSPSDSLPHVPACVQALVSTSEAQRLLSLGDTELTQLFPERPVQQETNRGAPVFTFQALFNKLTLGTTLVYQLCLSTIFLLGSLKWEADPTGRQLPSCHFSSYLL